MLLTWTSLTCMVLLPGLTRLRLKRLRSVSPFYVTLMLGWSFAVIIVVILIIRLQLGSGSEWLTTAMLAMGMCFVAFV